MTPLQILAAFLATSVIAAIAACRFFAVATASERDEHEDQAVGGAEFEHNHHVTRGGSQHHG